MSPANNSPSAPSPLPVREAILAQRTSLRRAMWLSSLIGVLMLAPSWYMFEVYGRVLNSRNTTTLFWLTVMVLGLYAVIELLDVVRARQLHELAAGAERRLRETVFNAVFQANLQRRPGGSVQAFNDLRNVREFLASPFATAVLDLPAAILCLILLFLLGFWLGVLALIGAGVQAMLAYLTERRTMPPLQAAIAANLQANTYATMAVRNAQVIEALGMQARVHERWMERQNSFLAKQGEASDYAGITSAVAKIVQIMQGSVLLGGATWVMLHGNLWGGAGMVIVASILGGRALQPLATVVAQWRAFVQWRDAQGRLTSLLQAYQPPSPSMPLPAPTGRLTVEDVHAGPPGTGARTLKGVTFTALPGEVTLIIGPTAAGKTTLARMLVGIWPAVMGKVRLDGADVHAWDKQQLGPHIGYLPQSVELFDGTVAENVARFGEIDRDSVKAAIEVVGMTATIDALPDGIDTRIGEEGAILSGGQRQRLGLARALYGGPRLLVLDEPNASLDAAGDKNLLELLMQLKKAGVTVVAITHRNSLMPAVDKIVVLREGTVAAFGPRDEVMKAMKEAADKARMAKLAARGGPNLQQRFAPPGSAVRGAE